MSRRPNMDGPRNPHVRFGDLDKGAPLSPTPIPDANRSNGASIRRGISRLELCCRRKAATQNPFIPGGSSFLEGRRVRLVPRRVGVSQHRLPSKFSSAFLTTGATSTSLGRDHFESLSAMGAVKSYAGFSHGADCTCDATRRQAGAGTVGLVADRLSRNAVLIELNPEYLELARSRIANDAPLFAQVDVIR